MADKEHLRLKVLKALTAHLEGINPSNGYRYNLVGAVFRGRLQFSDSDPLPCLSLLDSPNPDYGDFADEGHTVRKDDWVIILQGWVQDDRNHPTDKAYDLLVDVESRLSDVIAVNNQGAPRFAGIHLLGGLISSLTMASPVVRPPEAGVSDRAYFYLPIRIGLAVDLTNPWLPSKRT